MSLWQRCFSGLRRLSLKSVIVLGIAFGILMPALVVGPLIAIDNYQQMVSLRVNAMLSQYTKLLQQSMVAPVWQVDVQSAQVFIDALMLNPDVVSVQVDDAVLGKFAFADKPERRKGNILQEELPLLREGASIGKVRVEISTALVEQQLGKNLQTVGIALLLQLVISFVLLVFLFERRLMRPLHRLLLDTQRLANNELVQPVEAMHPDEMGELALGLDRMREKIGMHIEQIGQFNASLEQRVQDRTQALHLANQELQSALDTLKNAQEEIQRSDRLAALGSLVAGIAHELNTPIGNCVVVASTLQGMSDHFSKEIETGLKRSSLLGYVNQIKQANELLVRNLSNAAELIGSFKQVAVDRTSAKRRKFALDDMVAETLRTLAPSFKHSGYTVEASVQPDIVLDSYPGPLGQVLNNLISNAMLHGFEGRSKGRIHISGELLDIDHVQIVVADNGVGIPEANLSRIFDPFFTTKLGQGGSGLGLNIVYNLVSNVLGGSIKVESDVQQGTSFYIVINRIAPTTESEEGK